MIRLRKQERSEVRDGRGPVRGGRRHDEDVIDAVREDAAGPGEVAGWSTGGRANTAAVIRWGLWALIVLGPLLGMLAFVSVPAAGNGQAPQAPAQQPATGGQGAAGFASLFVGAYLRAGEGDEQDLAAFYPAASQTRLEGKADRRRGEGLTVVRLRQTDVDVWSVTVAARVTTPQDNTSAQAAQKARDRADAEPTHEGTQPDADTLHYFQVPVAVGPAGGQTTGYTALAMPAEVSAPPHIKTPPLVYGPKEPALSTDPRTKAITEFLGAYLAGRGDLDRYLAPGTHITAIRPAPYTALSVDSLAVEGETGQAATEVPADGTRQRVLVDVRATGADQLRTPLTYALTLKTRAGRWEIAALDGAPARPTPTSPAVPTP
ncbi:conjugal transfer protein [Streptomyces sp. SGAir0957]